MQEELLVTARDNALIDPSLHIWTWEVAMYLFMGGLTAGVMVFAAVMTLLKKDDEAPFASTRLAVLAPILLSLGMTTLFLDLEHKLFVFRFYTSFQITSPMSWVHGYSLLSTRSRSCKSYQRCVVAIRQWRRFPIVLQWAA